MKDNQKSWREIMAKEASKGFDKLNITVLDHATTKIAEELNITYLRSSKIKMTLSVLLSLTAVGLIIGSFFMPTLIFIGMLAVLFAIWLNLEGRIDGVEARMWANERSIRLSVLYRDFKRKGFKKKK